MIYGRWESLLTQLKLIISGLLAMCALLASWSRVKVPVGCGRGHNSILFRPLIVPQRALCLSLHRCRAIIVGLEGWGTYYMSNIETERGMSRLILNESEINV